MVSIEKYHENLRKIFDKNTIAEAMIEMDKLDENSRILIGYMAYNDKLEKDEDGTIKIDIEDFEKFHMFASLKKEEGYFEEPLTTEELKSLELIEKQDQINRIKTNKFDD